MQTFIFSFSLNSKTNLRIKLSFIFIGKFRNINFSELSKILLCQIFGIIWIFKTSNFLEQPPLNFRKTSILVLLKQPRWLLKTSKQRMARCINFAHKWEILLMVRNKYWRISYLKGCLDNHGCLWSKWNEHYEEKNSEMRTIISKQLRN